MSVDLPEPDGAHDGDEALLVDGDVDTVEGADLRLAGAVGAV